jgi:hypothetical protein
MIKQTLKFNLLDGCKEQHKEVIRFLVNNYNCNPMGFVAYQKEDEIYYFGRLVWSINAIQKTENDLIVFSQYTFKKRFPTTAFTFIVGRINAEKHYKSGICKECRNTAKWGLRKGWCLRCYRKNTGRGKNNIFRSVPNEFRGFIYLFGEKTKNQFWTEKIKSIQPILDKVDLSDEEKFKQELIERFGYVLWEQIKVAFKNRQQEQNDTPK